MATDRFHYTYTDVPSPPWAQTSFLDDVAPLATIPHPTQPITDALDRLARSLAEQARQRGRSPVPKPTR